MTSDLAALVERIRDGRALAAKSDIATVINQIGIPAPGAPQIGDDCAAIPDGDGYLLFANEGFQDGFVQAMPWFAGYCGIMVNASDIAAMGGRPIAVVDALWSKTAEEASPIIQGIAAGSTAYGIPVVGGHTNLHSNQRALSVAILGRAKKLLTSFDAQPGDQLIVAIDLRGRWHDPHPFWDASSGLDHEIHGSRLREDLEILPSLAEDNLSVAAKDISMAGILGTALMLAECSRVGMAITLDTIPMPPGEDIYRWLTAFPSYGYLIACKEKNAKAVIERFHKRGIAASTIGWCNNSLRLDVLQSGETQMLWDLNVRPLMGCVT